MSLRSSSSHSRCAGLPTRNPEPSAIARSVEHVVETDRELERTETPRKVSADRGADLDELVAQLVGDLLECRLRQLAQIFGPLDGFENPHYASHPTSGCGTISGNPQPRKGDR